MGTQVKRQKQLERHRYGRLVAALGCIVVFATAIALMVPALSMTRGTLVCGVEEHQHSEACYQKVLVCGQNEGADHAHVDACYESRLACELPEHVHSNGCYESVVAQSAGDEADDAQSAEADGSVQVAGVEGAGADGAVENVVEGTTDGNANGNGGAVGYVDFGTGASGSSADVSNANYGTADDGVYAPGADVAGRLSTSDSGSVAADGVAATQPGAIAGQGDGAGNADGAEATAMPAQSFKAGLKDADDNVVLTVAIEAPEGAFPANTFMKIDGVLAKDVQVQVQVALQKALGIQAVDSRDSGAVEGSGADFEDEAADAGGVASANVAGESAENAGANGAGLAGLGIEHMTAVDITFFDEQGNQVQPAKKVDVKIAAEEVRRANKPAVVHVVESSDIVKAPDGSVVRKDGKPFENPADKYVGAKLVKKVQLVNEIEEDASAGNENALSFKADEFSPYVIVELDAQSAEAVEASEDGEGAASNLIETPDRPRQSFQQDVVGEDGAVTLSVSVEAPEGALPEGSTMIVTPVEDDDVLGVAKDQATADGALGEDAQDVPANAVQAVAADITFLDADGNKVEPLVGVQVTMTTPLVAEAPADALAVVHVADDLSAQVVEDAEVNQSAETVAFGAAEFSVYAIVYTVDFHWEANGKTYEFSIPGGGFISLAHLVEVLGIADYGIDGVADAKGGNDAPSSNNASARTNAEKFVANVKSAEFSNPELVWVGKTADGATVGELKEANALDVRYSANLTKEQIAEINAQTVDAGDWVLISVRPFTSEESLTVTMVNGNQFVVKVTDAQAVSDAEKDSIDASKSYLICYEVTTGGKTTYYLLKNDGTVDSSYHPDFDGDTDEEHDFEHLNSTYAWSFNHIFKEQDVEHHLDKNYYLIRPIDNQSRTITLNNAGEELVQQGNNNVAVIQSDGGFVLEGYHNIGTEEEHRYVHLGFNGSTFVGVDGDGVTIRIYEMDSLPTYDYTVRSADEARGTVSVSGGTQQTVHHDGASDTHYYEATSNHDKNNAGTITALPVTHMNQGQNKWVFDHWELDGLALDRNQYPSTIAAETLPIPHNGSNLVAYFRQNPNYAVPPDEKEPSSIEDMTGWLEGLQAKEIPLVGSATNKTAEVYDYQNRIYRLDFTSKANFQTFAGNIDMAFCLDVSNSMYFPSALVETTTSNYRDGNNNISTDIPIYQINNSGSGNGWSYNNRNWLDTSRGYNNPYYLITDASGTATVFKIYYKEGNWRAIDASRTGEWDGNQRRYIIFGDPNNGLATNYGQDSLHPFTKGDNDNTTYTIYDAGDNGYNRFHYLSQSLGNGSTDLNTIAGLLAVAGESSPNVKVAYNTFSGSLGSQRQDFIPATTLSVDLAYSSGGGTRPDQAFNDAQSFTWTGDYTLDDDSNLVATDRYVILVTDGAPQGGTAPSSGTVEDAVRQAAKNLKNNSHVKLITVGLSMDNVTSGKRLLYDLADNDKNGEKMFYMAESASDLTNIFRQITKVLMEDAVVIGDITDTVGEAFYLVDKATGLPLSAGDSIDIEGNLTTDETKIAGVVQSDGKTIKWVNQPIDSITGWHGVAYVKAQEELLGGNAIKTNEGEATVVATKYRIGGNNHTFDTTLVRDTLKLSASLPSPKVNVNELTFFNNETAWTVYLGTAVDPKKQLRAIYDSLVVEEVVNTDGGLHYTLGPNTIEERWDTATGTAATFPLPDLIKRLIRKDPTLEARYFNGSELNWDNFLTDISASGITLPYHEYGLTDGGNVKIILEKTVASGEEDDLINQSPHETTVTGNKVEEYVLRVAYAPDYTVTPIGQGGQSADDFYTGIFGTMYQGHAAGRESSENIHEIHVFAKNLEITKQDMSGNNIDTAKFKLYRSAKKVINPDTGEETGEYEAGAEDLEVRGETKKVVQIGDEVSTSGGTITVNDLAYAPNGLYYLLETKAPDGYIMDPEPIEIRLYLDDIYTKYRPSGESIPETQIEDYISGNPYNWIQTVSRFMYSDSEVGTGDTAKFVMTVKNNPGYELPSTGGPGTNLIYLFGIMLTGLASTGLLMKMRRRSAV